MLTALPATRVAIAALIPHQGAMCLLDCVERLDADSILCASATHRDNGNPLRRDGLLPAIAGVEYAAQAMALHGALSDGEAQPIGFLSALRGLRLSVERLDDIAGPLAVTATVEARERRGMIYGFTVSGGGRALLEGQAVVVLPERAP
ncbi:phosphotransferase [Plastoroseomonas hellenica]|uniref:phosphotransferase n=1 Tax=Plastoroseomonas hellenica TaxID=2687306 RepID=UPI001BA539FA|nr:phosphotransferase [Plastoroseomonas hellenica]MBR0644593.1 hydroxymyristoyl-ACP dehydratase [Plastoroseomonas hellenica]